MGKPEINQVDELRKALEKAESDRKLLEALMENVPNGITIADAPDMKIRMVSRYGQEVLGAPCRGITVEEFTERWEVLQPDGVTPMPDDELPLVRAIKYGEIVRNKEIVQVNEDGLRLALLCDAAPIRDQAGNITAGVVAWQDITERKRVEEREHRREREQIEFYRRTVEAATDGKLILCDKEAIEELAGQPLASWEVSIPADLHVVRDRMIEIAKSLGQDKGWIGKLVVASIEAMTNAIKHACGGLASLHHVDSALMFVISDKGQGIPALILPDVALRKRFSTVGTFGIGYKMMIAFCDKVYLSTGPDGTTVGLRMELHSVESLGLETGKTI